MFNVLPAPMAYRAAPISVSSSPRHTSANTLKAIAGGGEGGRLLHWYLRVFNFPTPFSYVEHQTRRQLVPFLKSLVRLSRGWNPRPTGCKAGAQSQGHHTGLCFVL